jgi:hypothetical protein
MTNISPAVTALLERMDTNPEEFIFIEYSYIKHGIGSLINDTRWENITWTMMGDGNKALTIFTPEEVEAYTTKLGGIVRRKLEEDVCQELLKPQKEPEQMELFPNQSSFPPRGRTSAVTAQQITTEALRILNAEIGKNRTKEVMDDPTGHIL